VDRSGQQLTLLKPRIEAVASARLATTETLRLCATERDAVLVSIRMSGCSLETLGDRIGVTKQAVSKWARDGVPSRRVRAFCNATGSLLLQQYTDLQRAMRASQGMARECDRIADIAKHTEAA